MKTKKILVGLAAFLFAAAFVFSSCDRDTAVTGVELSSAGQQVPQQVALVIGETFTLTATVIPNDATNRNVSWSSNNENVVTVSDGVVTAVGIGGPAQVTVTTEDGNHTASAAFTVGARRIPVESVTIDGVARTGDGEPIEFETVEVDGVEIKTITVTHGDFFSFQHTVYPPDTEEAFVERGVTWTSRNTANIIINPQGAVTFAFPGTTFVVLTSVYDATIQDSVRIIVEPIYIEDLTVQLGGEAITELDMRVGHTRTLTPIFYPTTASFQEVEWIVYPELTGDDVVITVVDGVVRGVADGTVTLIAMASQRGFGEIYVEIEVTVLGVAATGVEIEPTSLSLTPGAISPLVATVLPAEADERTVTWTSSNPTVASVSTAGVVMAAHPGTTTITATTTDGGFTATATVTVTAGAPAECVADHIGHLLIPGTVNFVTDETWTTTARGRTLVWSDLVHALGCEKDDFYGANLADMNSGFASDCRRGSASGAAFGEFAQGAVVGANRSFFSWCAVVTHAEILCPAPWRVPTREDFAILDIHFDGDGTTQRFFAAHGSNPIAADSSYRAARHIVDNWGVTILGFIGQTGPTNLGHTWPTAAAAGPNFTSRYWQIETMPGNATQAGAFEIVLGLGTAANRPQGTIRPTQGFNKHFGNNLRCVRDN